MAKKPFFVSNTKEIGNSLYLLIPSDKVKEHKIQPDTQYAVKLGEVSEAVLDE